MLLALVALAGLARLSEPLPFWSPTAPLPLPFTQAIVASPVDEKTLYAVAGADFQTGVLFETVDAGASWIPLAPLPAGEQIASLAIDPEDPLLLLMTTSRPGTGANTVYRSVDGGTTFSPSLDPGIFCGPVGFARAGAVALIGCGARLYRTLDGGENWDSVPNPAGSQRFVPSPDDSVLAIWDGSLHRSFDDGSSWTVVGSTPECPDVTSLVVSPVNPLEILAGTSVPHALGILCGGVFRSLDGGATWEGSLDFHAVGQIEYDVHSPSRAFLTTGPSGFNSPSPFSGVFASEDGGRSWTDLAFPEISDIPIGIALSSSGRVLYAFSFGGTIFAHRFRRPTLLEPR